MTATMRIAFVQEAEAEADLDSGPDAAPGIALRHVLARDAQVHDITPGPAPGTADLAPLLDDDIALTVFWRAGGLATQLRALCPGRCAIVPAWGTGPQDIPALWRTFAADIFVSLDSGLHHALTGMGCDSLLARYAPPPGVRTWGRDAPLTAVCTDTGYDMAAVIAHCAHWRVRDLHVVLPARAAGARRAQIQDLRARIAPGLELRFPASAPRDHALCFVPGGSGAGVLDAMACGQVPVGVGGGAARLRDYVADGHNGLLAGPGQGPWLDAAGLARAIEALSAAGLATIAAAHAGWLADLDRVAQALRAGATADRHDAGAAFARAVRQGAGRHAGGGTA